MVHGSAITICWDGTQVRRWYTGTSAHGLGITFEEGSSLVCASQQVPNHCCAVQDADDKEDQNSYHKNQSSSIRFMIARPRMVTFTTLKKYLFGLLVFLWVCLYLFLFYIHLYELGAEATKPTFKCTIYTPLLFLHMLSLAGLFCTWFSIVVSWVINRV